MNHPSSEIGEIARELRKHVALMRSSGIHGFAVEENPVPSHPSSQQPLPQQPAPTQKEKLSTPPLKARVERKSPEREKKIGAQEEIKPSPSIEKSTPPPQPAPASPSPAPVLAEALMPASAPEEAPIPVTPNPSPRPSENTETRASIKINDSTRVHGIIGKCTGCTEQTIGAHHLIFGAGNPNADLMIVGESAEIHGDSPDAPFRGREGELLAKIIEGGMKLNRDEIYIANIIPSPASQSGSPPSEEIRPCRAQILDLIDTLKPKVILTLGRTATQTLLETTQSVTNIRGTWQEIKGIPLMPTFHPVHLLRNPAGKRPVWSDIQNVMKFLKDNPQSG